MEEENQVQTTKKSVNPAILIGALLVVVLLVIGGLFLFGGTRLTGVDPEEEVATEETFLEQAVPGEVVDEFVEEAVEGEVGGEEADDTLTVRMTAGSYFFTPNQIRAREGQNVRVEFTSQDMMHDFNIDELGVNGPITNAGQTVTIEFVAGEAGEYEFYCSVGNHRQLGQVGTLIVE